MLKFLMGIFGLRKTNIQVIKLNISKKDDSGLFGTIDDTKQEQGMMAERAADFRTSANETIKISNEFLSKS